MLAVVTARWAQRRWGAGEASGTITATGCLDHHRDEDDEDDEHNKYDEHDEHDI